MRKSKGLQVCLPTGSCTVIFVWYESYIVDNSQNVRHSILRLWFARAVKKIKANSCELVCTWAENFELQHLCNEQRTIFKFKLT